MGTPELQRSTPDAELMQQHACIMAKPELYRVLHEMPEYVFLLNSTRQIVYANPASSSFARAAHGADCIGMRLGELFTCANATGSEYGCGSSAVCESCGALATVLRVMGGQKTFGECQIATGTDTAESLVTLRIWGAPYWADGIQFSLVVATDISREMRLQMLDSIFLHDVMNTASALQGMLLLLDDGDISWDEAKSFVSAATARLVEEIRHQRVIRGAELDALEPEFRQLRSHEVLAAVKSVFCELAEANGKRLQVITDDLVDVTFVSDDVLLGRVLGNMVKNAMEATAAGNVVTLRQEVCGNWLQFRCHNEEEIPPHVQSRIFKHSFSTKGTGRGFGTYSIKLLTERYLGGRAYFISNSAEGTTFVVELPLTPKQQDRLTVPT